MSQEPIDVSSLLAAIVRDPGKAGAATSLDPIVELCPPASCFEPDAAFFKRLICETLRHEDSGGLHHPAMIVNNSGWSLDRFNSVGA
jgi:hypothetical protein